MVKFITAHFWSVWVAELLILTPILTVGGALIGALVFGKGAPAQSGLLYGAIVAALVMVATIWTGSDAAWYRRVLLSLASIVAGLGGGVAVLILATYRIVGAMKAG